MRAYGEHIVIDDTSESPPWRIARLTPLGMGQFTAAFRRHNGQWEALPVHGDLDETVTAVVELLGPFLEPMSKKAAPPDPRNGPSTSGTDH